MLPPSMWCIYFLLHRYREQAHREELRVGGADLRVNSVIDAISSHLKLKVNIANFLSHRNAPSFGLGKVGTASPFNTN